jgi:hypothetical protein
MFMLNPRSSAFLARLLFRSDISFAICAETFLSRYSLVGSRHTSASRIGRATFFYALVINLAPSLCTFLSAFISLTTPTFLGPYYAEAA